MANNLPKIKENLHVLEKHIKPSVDSLVKVDRIKNVMIGRYFYGSGEWQVDNVHGAVVVVEWWPMPVIGTGNRIQFDSECACDVLGSQCDNCDDDE